MQKTFSQQPTRLEKGRYQSIQCVMGAVWLTCANDDHDYILQAGESLDLADREGVIVEAIEKTALVDLRDLVVIPEYAIV